MVSIPKHLVMGIIVFSKGFAGQHQKEARPLTTSTASSIASFSGL
jgi:hypothetical protein